MKVTTKEIISLLPFEEEFKVSMLETYDNLDADRKLTVTQILWRAYYAFYTMKLQENLDLALLYAEKDETPLDEGFYAKVKEKTKEDMKTLTIDKTTTTGLTAARSQLQEIISDKPQA